MKKSKLQSLLSLAPQPKPRKPMNKLQAHANRLTTHSAYDDYEEPTTKLSTAFVVVLALHVVAVGGIYAFHSIKAKRREADGTAVATKSVAPAPAASTTPAPAQAPAAPVAKSGAPVAAPTVTSAAIAPVANNTTPKTPAPVKVENTASHLPAPAGPSAVIPPQKLPAQTGQPAAQPLVTTQVNATVAAKAQPSAATPIKAVAAVQPASGGEASAKSYTVVKGDNPVAIAKKMHVSYEEMLKLNGIDDPKKLQIGQVLKMPPAKASN
jgi:LysM repeat protein